ncbi:unnamed protein product [Heligmosomoides polygyrus]|uniref:CCHC-type domain-containing protein n=1 Tax=Heligmosomoides polygyrus TaxID=6339 RepID=A0A183GVD8_HELPZ|nr:unnamed protein product [Heligmosomoides polygyrus]
MSDKLEAIANGSSSAQSSAKSSTARDDIVKVLTERIEVLERTASQKADEQNESSALKTIVETVAPKAAEQPPEKDDEYMQRLLDEVRDEGDLMETADEVSDEDEPSEKRARPSTLTKRFDKKVLFWQINSIKAKIKIMEMTLKNFPYRKLGETGKGVEPWHVCPFCGMCGHHTPDSCSVIATSEQRNEVVTHSERCRYCLERMCQQPCVLRTRRCTYCARIRGTVFEDAVPKDEGHNLALCPVPESKRRMKRRMERQKKLLIEKEHQLLLVKAECRKSDK